MSLLDVDGAGNPLCVFFFWQCQVKDAVVISSGSLVHIHRIVDGETTGEGLFPIFPADPALVVRLGIVVFLVFEGDGESVTREAELEVLLLQTGGDQFEFVGLVGLKEIDRDSGARLQSIEAPEFIVEPTVEILMEELINNTSKSCRAGIFFFDDV